MPQIKFDYDQTAHKLLGQIEGVLKKQLERYGDTKDKGRGATGLFEPRLEEDIVLKVGSSEKIDSGKKKAVLTGLKKEVTSAMNKNGESLVQAIKQLKTLFDLAVSSKSIFAQQQGMRAPKSLMAMRECADGPMLKLVRLTELQERISTTPIRDAHSGTNDSGPSSGPSVDQ